MTLPLPDFDIDFATPATWALMYRACGLQIIPSYYHHEVPPGAAWKRPKLSQWTELHHKLAPQATFDRWYGPGGEHVDRTQMGIITGPCSGCVLVVDLDEHTKPSARLWWTVLLAAENNGIELETVEQVTGGGGRQKLFRYPASWHAPTNRTAIGVDIRGQGGFAMMPPSLHESGRAYSWAPGCAPWEVEILDAPPWLLDAIEMLVEAHGGDQSAGPRERTERTASPGGADHDAWGNRQDGREAYMARLVWAAVLDHWREVGPKLPSEAAQRLRAAEAYVTYERSVTSRLVGAEKAALLEREGRGAGAFWRKWRACVRHWNDRVAEEGAKPKPHQEPPQGPESTIDWSADFGSAETPHVDPATGGMARLILTGAEFVGGFHPPSYLVDGMVQQSYIYSLTARTGHGKTAVAMHLAQAVARGVPFHGRETRQGSVLFLAGENPDDVRARYLVLAGHEGFNADRVPLHFIDGVVDINGRLKQLRDESARLSDLALVIVDTAAAYFPGDDHNSNAQQAWYARLLRELTRLPGKPTGIVNCHPIKNATQDNLVPLGGSAFINEVDGNLTLWADDKTCTLGASQDKWRGAQFESMAFELRVVTSDQVRDAKGRHMPSVVAVPITEMGAERRHAVTVEDSKTALRLIHADKGISLANIARRAGWLNDKGQPLKAKVQRLVARLAETKLVEKLWDSTYQLTKKGCRVAGLPWKDHDEND